MKAGKTMSKEKKYYELLDKLAEAIQKGKSANMIEKIKDKIEKVEHEIYLQKIKEKNNNE